MILRQDQIKQLCGLYYLSIRKRYYVILQGELASVAKMRKIWKLHISFALPRGFWLNLTRDPVSTEYTRGYVEKWEAEEAMKMTLQILEENAAFDPEPDVMIDTGFEITFKNYAVGTKLDMGNGGKKGLSFPDCFYLEDSVFFSQQDTIAALKALIAYIVDHLQKKKEWSGIKDPNGVTLAQTKRILSS